VIVVDAGVLATALADDGEDGRRMRARLGGNDLAAPAIVDLEVASVIRKGVRANLLTEYRAAQAISDLAALPIERVPHTALLRRVWDLHHNVSPYDAAYVAVSEAFSATLVTTDRKLANATGPRCEIEIL
jgi:predicted nucleic acid-binding protein